MTPHIYSDGNYQFGPKKGDERRGDAEALREAIGKGEKIRVSADDGKRPSLVNTDIKRR